MTRFKAIFVEVDGLEETHHGGSYGLSADDLAGAEAEALKLTVPPGANCVKVLDEGRVVRRLGLDTDA